jgi:serine/threonine-protein kinase RsbW
MKLSAIIHDKDGILKAMDVTEQLANALGFSSLQQLFLRLAVEEVCTNAYEYCQRTKQKHFHIRWHVVKNCLNICIRHQGKLFEVKRDDRVNISARGRGLQIVLHIMDEVDVQVKGRYVILCMSKYRGEGREDENKKQRTGRHFRLEQGCDANQY